MALTLTHLYDFANVGPEAPYVEVPSVRLYDFANVSLVPGIVGAFLYDFANTDQTTPTPHLWYVVPSYGKEGWQFKLVGYGLGDTAAEFSGLVKLNGLTCGIVSWSGVAGEALPHTIDPTTDTADPVHQEVVAIVPVGAVSGVLTVETDGP